MCRPARITRLFRAGALTLAPAGAQAEPALQAAKPKRLRAMGCPPASAVSCQATLACPCGQVACCASQSIAKLVVAKPWAARACCRPTSC